MQRLGFIAFAVGIGTACEGEPSCPPEPAFKQGTLSGATCNGSPLTYENFGERFMQDYCTRCHSSAREGEEARACAPDGSNFDTFDEIMELRDYIEERSAAGPNGVNDKMPPSGAKPTEQERRDLGTWLACEEDRLP